MRDLDNNDWLSRIEEIGELEGYFEPLGAAHAALFADRGPVLLVSFETRATIRTRSEEQLPLGFTLAEGAEHSSLTLIAKEESWFRDPAVYAYFDRLVDEAFFEDFDRVVFYGAGSCGYAAAAFSVTAPGATVVTLAPQATLSARRASWDNRFLRKRRLDFTSRYGYAPDMLDGAGQGYVVYDPLQTLDAMHAALMARPQVTLLPCRNLGRAVETALSEMDVLEQMLVQACAGTLDAASFWRLYRARRNSPRYLRGLAAQLDARKRHWLEALLCRNVVHRLGGPRFRNRLATLEAQLEAQGRALPAPLPLREHA
ncbi:phosphoadenosine phosphosulfate reductase [Rhodobacter sp. TJ_12]|uniref:phosphoadenosine phosphosulfate reductase n=1 Tax=Rhodobacter sp. TJ_12 TaxID=2029399 RepID=UPI001CBE6A18|nr:phosphoadenosine phosphosulfate reductase [Rhodobacter sp. TJ_12]